MKTRFGLTQASKAKGKVRTKATIFACALSLPLLLTACGSSAQITVGSCIADPGSATSSSKITSVSCAASHYGEVVGTYTAIDGTFPGAQIISNEAEETCNAAFESLIGVKPENSVYDLFPLTPSENSWNSGDRTVFCVVKSSDGQPLTEPVEGTMR